MGETTVIGDVFKIAVYCSSLQDYFKMVTYTPIEHASKPDSRAANKFY
jgi:hypothetical protein